MTFRKINVNVVVFYQDNTKHCNRKTYELQWLKTGKSLFLTLIRVLVRVPSRWISLKRYI